MSNPQITIKPNRTSLTVEARETTIVQVSKQGPPGATGQPGNATFESAELDSACQPGQPLYLKANGHVDLAKADTIATARVCGLAVIAVGATFSVDYTPEGVVERSDWSGIADAASLVPGATYFLSATTAGKITAIAPTTSGQLVVAIGMALTAQKLAVEIQPSILL